MPAGDFAFPPQPQEPAGRYLCISRSPTNSLYNWSSFNTNNRTASTTVNSATFTYDLAGNVINDGTNRYVYDPEGRICAVWSPGPVYTQYVYDANGQRVAKGTIPATDWPTAGNTCNAPTAANGFTLTAQYLRGQSGDQDIELTGSGALSHQNIFEGAGLAATYWNYGTAAAPTYELSYNFSDWLGTKRLQTNNNPSPETYWTSDPFGNYLTPVGTEADATGTTAPIHFTGKERDSESGNDYFGARYYGSSMGRFMSPDPLMASAKIWDPQTWNRYTYGRNNPLRMIDPTGMAEVTAAQCAQDKNCVTVNVNVIYDKSSNGGKGLTNDQKAAFEKGPLQNAKDQYGNADIHLNVSFSAGGINDKGKVDGTQQGALNVLVSDKVTGPAVSDMQGKTAISYIGANSTNTEDLAHEMAHQFMGDTQSILFRATSQLDPVSQALSRYFPNLFDALANDSERVWMNHLDQHSGPMSYYPLASAFHHNAAAFQQSIQPTTKPQ